MTSVGSGLPAGEGPRASRTGNSQPARRRRVAAGAGPARSWWSGRFVEMLRVLGLGEPLPQGRRIARAGNVAQLTISASLVVALVRDGDETYRARIGIRAYGAAEWDRIERELARQAIHTAKLLAGQMPTDIERVLDDCGLRLFPDRLADVAMDCTCPGWEIPCRHLAAACWVLAESFDADPFGVLAWRGRGRDELLGRLRVLRDEVPRRPGDRRADAGRSPALAELVDTFWTTGGAPELPPPPALAVPGSVRRVDALLEQLDPLPLTLGRHDVTELLRPVYRAITDPS